MTQINTENSPALSANQATNQVNNQVNNQVTDTDTQGSNTTSQQPNSNMGNNVDMSEIGKFTQLASQWWDKQGPFATLHEINPLRLNWIEENVIRYMKTGLTGKTVLDVGCGGGILTESMARRGADATGVDLGLENLQAASVHAEQNGLTDRLRYKHIAIEQLAAEQPESYDVVTCMEMLEHVPDPSQIVQACFDLLKPGGVCVLSTINRNPKSYLFAIIGAEYVLGLLDRGTHDYAKFITPAELDKMAITAGFNRQDLIGLHYNPITKRYWLAQNVDVNYMMSVVKPI